MASQPKSGDGRDTDLPHESREATGSRKLALALALVLSSTGAYARNDPVTISSSKEVLKSLVEQVQLKYITLKKSELPDSNIQNVYGRNFENYAKNFENYAKNFENYAKNFENYGRNFENPLSTLRMSEAYAAVTGPAALPNGAPVPEDVDSLLQMMITQLT